jgi:hypothetical protein
MERRQLRRWRFFLCQILQKESFPHLQNTILNTINELNGKIFLHPKLLEEISGNINKCKSICSKYNVTTVKIHSVAKNNALKSLMRNHFDSRFSEALLGGKIFDHLSGLIIQKLITFIGMKTS